MIVHLIRNNYYPILTLFVRINLSKKILDSGHGQSNSLNNMLTLPCNYYSYLLLFYCMLLYIYSLSGAGIQIKTCHLKTRGNEHKQKQQAKVINHPMKVNFCKRKQNKITALPPSHCVEMSFLLTFLGKTSHFIIKSLFFKSLMTKEGRF